MAERDISDFEGDWAFSRRVTPFDGSPAAEAEGVARIVPVQDHWRYEETATLRLAGHAPVRAERRYLWHRAGSLIAVRFADGRDFHRFDPNAAAPEAAHWCDPDQYDVTYDFAAWPNWQSTWRVSGPRKDYRMRTAYTPLSASKSAALRQ